MNNKISIIVPVYNAEKTLSRCVSALMGQTHQNIEIILVNDGSRDCSLQICYEFAKKDQRIVVVDKTNGGVSSARNEGLNIATGEFIMFCDSDDWAEPDWCEELVLNYQRDSLVMCGFFVDGQQNFMPHEIKGENGIEYFARRKCFDLKMQGFNVPWNKIYLRKILLKNKIQFNEKLSNGEDLLFNVQYLNAISGNIIILDKCVFHYSWPSEGNLSTEMDEKAFEKTCILFHELKSVAIVLFEGIEDFPTGFYTDFYAQFERIIYSVLVAEISILKKYLRLRLIMRSYEYQISAANSTISSNKLYEKLCRIKSPLGIMLWKGIKSLNRRRIR